jgi:hypothetical protein
MSERNVSSSEEINRDLFTRKIHLSTIDVIQHEVQLVWSLETVMQTNQEWVI